MRLIDADALIKWVQECGEKCPTLSVEKLFNTIKNAPTIEPKKVVEDYCRPRNLMMVAAEDFHRFDVPDRKVGKWVKDGEAYALYKCSACNDLCTVAGYANCIPEEQMYKAFKFCPNCGAKMERSEE